MLLLRTLAARSAVGLGSGIRHSFPQCWRRLLLYLSKCKTSVKRGHLRGEARFFLTMQGPLLVEAGFSDMSRHVDLVATEIYFLLCTRLFAQNSCAKGNIMPPAENLILMVKNLYQTHQHSKRPPPGRLPQPVPPAHRRSSCTLPAASGTRTGAASRRGTPGTYGSSPSWIGGRSSTPWPWSCLGARLGSLLLRRPAPRWQCSSKSRQTAAGASFRTSLTARRTSFTGLEKERERIRACVMRLSV